ncbi:MAG: hypothetical protein WCS42_27655, partial [Verrucomicrobiota bacterium]
MLSLFPIPSPALAKPVSGPLLWLVDQAGGLTNLQWSWGGTEPDTEWVIEASMDGGATWTPREEFNAGTRTGSDASLTAMFRVYGYNPNTGYSNVVDLTPQQTGLSDEAGNILTDELG